MNPKDKGGNKPDRNPASGATGTLRDRISARREITSQTFLDIKKQIVDSTIRAVEQRSPEVATSDGGRAFVQKLFDAIIAEQNLSLSDEERQQWFEAIVADALGFGPLEPLLADATITVIMVTSPNNVLVIQRGRMYRTDVVFDDENHLLRILHRITAPLGYRLDSKSPMLDAILPDGSHVNAVVRPVALEGATLIVRKAVKRGPTIEDVTRFFSIPNEVRDFLRACVVSRLNIILAGDRRSGRTTLLNGLCSFIPDSEQIVTIERAAELGLTQECVLRLQSGPRNREENKTVSTREIVENSLKMADDRLIVDEIHSEEAIPVLEAMCSGSRGVMTTLYALHSQDALERLKTLYCTYSDHRVSPAAAQELIASAVNILVHIVRMIDGTCKVVRVCEVQGVEKDQFILAELFEYEQTGLEGGIVIGRLRPTGHKPRCLARMEAFGIHLPPSVFGVGRYF